MSAISAMEVVMCTVALMSFLLFVILIGGAAIYAVHFQMSKKASPRRVISSNKSKPTGTKSRKNAAQQPLMPLMPFGSVGTAGSYIPGFPLANPLDRASQLFLHFSDKISDIDSKMNRTEAMVEKLTKLMETTGTTANSEKTVVGPTAACVSKDLFKDPSKNPSKTQPSDSNSNCVTVPISSDGQTITIGSDRPFSTLFVPTPPNTGYMSNVGTDLKQNVLLVPTVPYQTKTDLIGIGIVPLPPQSEGSPIYSTVTPIQTPTTNATNATDATNATNVTNATNAGN
jgi:hypothetical protein